MPPISDNVSTDHLLSPHARLSLVGQITAIPCKFQYIFSFIPLCTYVFHASGDDSLELARFGFSEYQTAKAGRMDG